MLLGRLCFMRFMKRFAAPHNGLPGLSDVLIRLSLDPGVLPTYVSLTFEL